MTTIETHVPAATAPAVAERGLAGIAGWITTTDHKRIGVMYIGGSLLALLGVVTAGLLLGLERIDNSSTLIDADAIGQLFSAYRVGLTFCVLVPLLLGVATAIVPLQVGARSLAFPRLAAAGFYAWLIGAGFVIGTIAANGGPGGGDSRMVAMYLLAHVVLLLGVLAGATSVATTILTTRAPGMNMRRLPMFTWSALVGALGMLIALPVVVGTLVYVYVDYRYGRSAFGGNAGIMDWIGFGSTQPLTFVYAIPAFGFAAEVVAVASGRRMPARGTVFAGVALIGVAALGGVAQTSFGLRADILDASFTTFLDDFLPYALFNLLPLLGAFIVLSLCARTLLSGRPRPIAPLAFGMGGALLVFAGMMANAVYLIGDAHLSGTVFEEGAWLSVCYGALLAGLGAVAFWGPKLFGRSMPGVPLVGMALLGMLGAALATFPLYIAGFADQQAGTASYADYSGPQELWNILTTVGHALVLLAVLAFIGLALISFAGGRAAGDDPWDAQTLEWATSSPPPLANFAEVHTVVSAEPLLDLKPDRTSQHAPVESAV